MRTDPCGYVFLFAVRLFGELWGKFARKPLAIGGNMEYYYVDN